MYTKAVDDFCISPIAVVVYYVVAVVSTAGTKHPYVHSVVIDGQTLKSYEVGDHAALFTLIDKLEHGISVQPIHLPMVAPNSKQ